MARFSELFRKTREPEEPRVETATIESPIIQDMQKENLEQDIYILDDEDGSREQKLQKVAEKEVQSAAADSLKRYHVIKMGRCPVCGEHLRQHLFATICESCGWHNYDVPRNGPVRVHLRHRDAPIEGDRCYVLKGGECLVIKDDMVTAKVPAASYDYVEYVWPADEVEQRHKQVASQLQISCGWCNEAADPSKDGFHLVHAAFGAAQERYCFCSDECYEAFRKMYPARVHRNCYERDCVECNLCQKRYGGEAEGIRMLAKDFLTVQRQKAMGQNPA
ncbi:MAG: hypothetical protein JXR77_04715 [Lentisphaeria bacterium]|nr:hypothetical protein [Lentisphaeria bacterium]